MKRAGLWLSALVMAFLMVLAVTVAQPPETANAYVFYKASETGEPLRWFRRGLEFRLSTVPPGDFDAGALQGLLEQAFETWVGTACGKVPEVRFMGTSTATQGTAPKTLNDAPDNVVVFIESASKWVAPKDQGGLENSPSWIAITKIAHNTVTGEIVDADIEINDGGFEFSIDGTPSSDEVDFAAMITHEVGHYFGLDHSADTDATMYASYSRSPDTATAARTLSQDDIDGICALYTDVPPHEEPDPGDDGDSGNGCGTGPLAPLALALGVVALRRRLARIV